MPYDYLFKYIIIGNSGSGKSSLLLRFTGNTFTDYYTSTIGVDFSVKNIKHPVYNQILKIQLWDTAGNELYRSITRSYYKNTAVVILTYDTTYRPSFAALNQWYDDVKNYTHENVVTVLVGNKTDLRLDKQITYEEGKKLADKHSSLFFETSSVTGENVYDVFEKSACEVYSRVKKGEINTDTFEYGVKTGNKKKIIELDEPMFSSCCMIS